jgi:hypothetical protein
MSGMPGFRSRSRDETRNLKAPPDRADGQTMEGVETRTRKDREATLPGLVAAYRHREHGAFESFVRPDMTLTLAGSSRLAGTYQLGAL